MSVTVYHSDLSYYVCTVYTGFILYCPVSLLYCPVSLLYCPVSLFNLYHCHHTSYSLNHMTFYDMKMHLIKEDGFQIEHLLFIMSYGSFLALSCRDRCTSYALI